MLSFTVASGFRLPKRHTVSTWLDCSPSTSEVSVRIREHIHEPFNDRSELSLKSVYSVVLITKRYLGHNIHKYLLEIKVPMTLALVKSQIHSSSKFHRHYKMVSVYLM